MNYIEDELRDPQEIGGNLLHEINKLREHSEQITRSFITKYLP
jgi:hypothetical protein